MRMDASRDCSTSAASLGLTSLVWFACATNSFMHPRWADPGASNALANARSCQSCLGEKILVANVDGSFHAMRSTCNHAGGPLHQGKLEGKIVTCPLHGSKWDVTSGSLVWFMKPLPNEPVYKVLVEGGEVFVER